MSFDLKSKQRMLVQKMKIAMSRSASTIPPKKKERLVVKDLPAPIAIAVPSSALFFEKLVRQTEKRSKLVNFEFDLTAEWIEKKFEEQNKKCSICGQEMTTHIKSKAHEPEAQEKRKKPFRYFPLNVSIDQTKHSCGYTKENIQLTHVTCNLSKLDLSMDDFIALCKQVSVHHQK